MLLENEDKMLFQFGLSSHILSDLETHFASCSALVC